MIDYNKDDIKEELTLENIFDVLNSFGGNPEYTNFGILSNTICHNPAGEGSRKLYFYENSMLFRCYTECDSYFDIFELVRKVADIQWHEEYDLNDAVRWIANYFHINGNYVEEQENKLEDWYLLSQYDRISNIHTDIKGQPQVVLKNYNPKILYHLNYKIKLNPWIQDGISEDIIKNNGIGFYPGYNQITIPHFDINGRFIGLRGRTLIKDEAEQYGKYRPVKINNIIYRHPLGMNLYNLNNSQNNIKVIKKVIVFEGEKSCLLYQTFFGCQNDISVACCGSSISSYQMDLLLQLGVNEIIVAFDRQFEQINDNEFQRLIKKLIKMNDKYKSIVTLSFIFDKHLLTEYKDAPVDKGKEIFLQLFNERIFL